MQPIVTGGADNLVDLVEIEPSLLRLHKIPIGGGEHRVETHSLELGEHGFNLLIRRGRGVAELTAEDYERPSAKRERPCRPRAFYLALGRRHYRKSEKHSRKCDFFDYLHLFCPVRSYIKDKVNTLFHNAFS